MGAHIILNGRERELPNLNGRGAHIILNGRERDLNGEYGLTSFLNGRKRVTKFEWSVGPTSKAIYGSDRFRLKRILFVSLCHLRFKLILTIEWTVHTAK